MYNIGVWSVVFFSTAFEMENIEAYVFHASQHYSVLFLIVSSFFFENRIAYRMGIV